MSWWLSAVTFPFSLSGSPDALSFFLPSLSSRFLSLFWRLRLHWSTICLSDLARSSRSLAFAAASALPTSGGCLPQNTDTMDLVRRNYQGTYAQDLDFGPEYGDFFDFSLWFESVIMTICPIVVFLAIAPFHILHYRKRPVTAKIAIHFWLLTASAVALTCLEVAKAVVWSLAPRGASPAYQASTALSAIAAFTLLLMIMLEYRHSLHSSVLSSGMFTVFFFVDILKTRSFFLRDGLATVGGLSVAVTVLKALIVILQEFPKPRSEEVVDNSHSPEAISGFWNQALCFWLNKTMLAGGRATMTMKNLESLGPDFSSERLSVEFGEIWQRQNKKSSWALASATTVALRWVFLAGLLTRMINIACTWAIAFTLRATVQSLGEEVPVWTPKALVLANVTLYVLRSIVVSLNSYYINKLLTLARGILTTQIIKKNFCLDLAKAKESTAITLMSTDVEQICDLIVQLYDYITAFPEMGFGLYFIDRIIGTAFVLPVIIAVFSSLYSIVLTKRVIKSQGYWNEGIQGRVAKMSAILQQIKGIKMIGLERTIGEYMQMTREQETTRSLKWRWNKLYSFINYSIGHIWTRAVGIIGGVFWTVWKDGLDPTEVYTYLSLSMLILDPILVITVKMPALGGALANFDRIQTYLLEDERQDPRYLCDSIDARYEKASLAKNSELEEKAAAETTQISVEDVSIAALNKEEGEYLLQPMNLSIDAGSLNMIIGPVGCGKSVLLRALLGEITLAGGCIRITTDNMAYCHQNAWIPSCTIRQAVLGENEFESAWYQDVLKACALDYDVSKITDQARTGNDNGGLLSGGQKQRVALARAVYSRAPILILDDILSALDRRTARLVFTRLLGADGLLRQQKRTVVIATHSVEWLQEANQVLSIDTAGNVVSYRSQEDIAAVKAVAIASQGKHADEDFEEEEVVLKVEEETEIDEIDIDTNLASDKTLYKLLLQGTSWLLRILVGIGLVGFAVFQTSNELWIRIWLAIDPKSKVLVAGLVAMIVADTLNMAYVSYFWHIVAIPKMANNLHRLFLNGVMSATLPFLTTAQSGSLLNRFSQDMTLFSYKMPNSMYLAWGSLLFALMMFAYVCAGASYSACALPFVFGLLWVLQNFYLRTSKQMRILDLEAKTPLFAKISETATGVEHLRAYGWQRPAIASIYAALDRSQKSFYYMYSIQRWLGFALNMISAGMVAVLLSVALLTTTGSSQASLGLGMFALMSLQQELNVFITFWTLLETSLGAVARLKVFLENTPLEEDGEGVVDQPSSWPSRGEVEFSNVSASYSAEPDAKLAIENLSLKVPAGESLAIVGRTGSGKSSIVLTLLHFLHHTGGVTIDGVDIRNVPRQQLRQVITTMPQDHVDIPGTVRNNVVPLEIMSTATPSAEEDKELIEVLTKVGLWDHISSQGGLDESITKMALSAGQRQLMSLARAMVHHQRSGSKIIVMDEATSNMDYQTDTTMHEVMETAFADCTRIVVTHRNTVLSRCHLLARMEDGRLTSLEKQSRGGSKNVSVEASSEMGE
ncbi:hypothetical protein VHEMI01398 [[Torrubiella] hemipterigena]|uniref:ABC transporter n=1 Tax=[Torrubiella] hemipterigena TaxID=1531966 RepID=A0A0A1T7D9_9HYPO|nr:hypothetical protein VHEMI01398 [[Torrubiella] hemipterigena]